MLEKMKFEGTIKPSLVDRVVVVRCYQVWPIEKNIKPDLEKIYWLPSYCTCFRFEIPEQYGSTHTVRVYGVNDKVAQADLTCLTPRTTPTSVGDTILDTNCIRKVQF